MNTLLKGLIQVDPKKIIFNHRFNILMKHGASTWGDRETRWFDRGSKLIGMKGKHYVRISDLADMSDEDFVNLVLSLKSRP